MMGQLPPAQHELFYDFYLEQHIPSDHLLRRIDTVLDLDGLRKHLGPHYSAMARPSVDPELMIRMLIIGYWAFTHFRCKKCQVENQQRTGGPKNRDMYISRL